MRGVRQGCLIDEISFFTKEDFETLDMKYSTQVSRYIYYIILIMKWKLLCYLEINSMTSRLVFINSLSETSVALKNLFENPQNKPVYNHFPSFTLGAILTATTKQEIKMGLGTTISPPCGSKQKLYVD